MRQSVVVVIPARFGSTRLPGKPLIPLAGKPLIQWVYENACNIPEVDQIIVATDHNEIYQTVRQFGGEVVMTPPDIATGSERVGYLVKEREVDIVVNLQGDEPLISTTAVNRAIQFLKENRGIHVCTLGCPLKTEQDWRNPSVVKVVLDKYQNAIYFSRSPIPFFRDTRFTTLSSVLRHIGVYIYRKTFLMQYLQWEPGMLETQEKLEQLRILEHGEKIQVVHTAECFPGVDTPEDIPIVEHLLKQRSTIS